MTTDIYPRIAVDVIVFTVASEESLREMIWNEDLVRPLEEFKGVKAGLSLFALTLGVSGSFERKLPGGFVRGDERIVDAAKRIVLEEIGLAIPVPLREVGVYDDPDRGGDVRTISFAYWTMVDFEELRKLLGGKDRVGLELVNSIGFMERFNEPEGEIEKYDGISRFGSRLMPTHGRGRLHQKRLPEDRKLALDHDVMVFYAWRKLRHAFTGRLDPFNYLRLNPLGEQFRISDLQEFHEVCRGEFIQRDLFRRNVTNDKSYLRQTNQRDNSRPGKPANLYTLQSPPKVAIEADEVED